MISPERDPQIVLAHSLGKEGVKGLWEDQLSVDGHERPKGPSDIQGDWHGQGSKHVILQPSNGRQLFPGQHFIRSE